MEMLQPHISREDWLQTPTNDKRGYIDPQHLKELWFHTGTICNLSCPFCLEGSKPGDDRLNKVTFEDAKPFIDEALTLGVEKFSFTGGEPFVVKDTTKILDYVLNHRPCLALTNATNPLKMRLEDITALRDKPYPLNFRISFDYPDPDRHDEGRGKGNFLLALETLAELNKRGFNVSIARQREREENVAKVDAQYQKFFKKVGISKETRIVSFPDFLAPGSMSSVPHITEKCMTQYHESYQFPVLFPPQRMEEKLAQAEYLLGQLSVLLTDIRDQSRRVQQGVDEAVEAEVA